ncbi:MAG: Rrf2 family transcriptional regulator [Proteobacteria bacterium]|nr:Rrf2 family transcriptional regulator [Pseudomonadota bacterium]
MKLNRSTSHAIRILIDCARADGALLKVADLAERLNLTQQNAFKIVHLLSRAELVAGMRGRNGGVRLARPAHEIRVGDIVRAMETTEIELESDGRSIRDRRITEGVNRVFDSALEAFTTILDRHTLSDLAAGGSPTRAKSNAKAKRKRAGTARSISPGHEFRRSR